MKENDLFLDANRILKDMLDNFIQCKRLLAESLKNAKLSEYHAIKSKQFIIRDIKKIGA